MKHLGLLFIVLLVTLCITTVSVPAQQTPKLQTPVLITSCGQSPGPLQVKLFAVRLKLEHTYAAQVTADDLGAKKKEGKSYKCLIIVTGSSLKGMGAAGVSIQDEIERTRKLIAEAKKQGIKVVGAHIEGMVRRAQGAGGGDNTDELSIDAVCPLADVLLVRQEGNQDGRFTTIAQNKNIPIVAYTKVSELEGAMKTLFGK
ncbi:MAG: DUF6305 family protein [bacterium]